MRVKVLRWLAFINPVLDVFAILLAGFLSMIIRFGFDWSKISHLWYFTAFIFVALVDVVLLYFYRIYDLAYDSLAAEITKVIRVFAYSFVVFFITTFFNRFVSFSRLSMVYFVAFSLIFQIAAKIVVYKVKKSMYKRGFGVRNLLFIGWDKRCEDIAKYMIKNPQYGYRVAGCLMEGSSEANDTCRNIGTIDGFEKVLKEMDISTVVISLKDRTYIEKSIKYCEYNYVQVYIIPDILDLSAATIKTGEIDNIPMLIVRETLLSSVQWKYKRLFDLVFAASVLIMTLPLFILISILIKVTSPGPVFFRHQRLGHNNEVINVLKFRTMVVNADKKLQDLLDKNPKLKGEYLRDYKLKDDPRITKMGKFLRKTSLDELPQIINILTGDMSWVGPRPIVKSEIGKYGDYGKIILRVPPGLTGYWQINGRNDTDYEERIKMDIFYINNWSFLLDMRIILKTIPVIFRMKGAY